MEQFPEIRPVEQPKFNIQNPLNTMEQMQGLGLRGLEAQKQQQAIQQADMLMKGRQAFGQILQGTVDPETGEPDLDKALALSAQHPETAFMYADILDKAMATGKLKAERHEQELKAGQDYLKSAHESFLGLAPRLNDTNHPITKSDVMGVFAGMRNYLPKKDVDGLMNDYLSKEQKGLTNPKAYIQSHIASTDQGLKLLESAQGTYTERNAMVNVRTPDGIQQMPRWQADQLMRNSSGGLFPQQNVAQGGSAPPAEPQLGGGEQPSAPSPTPYGYASEAEQEYAKEQPKQFNSLMDNVAKGAREAASSQTQVTQLRKTLPKIEPYLGLLGTEKLNLAKLAQAVDAGDTLGEVQSLLGVKSLKEAREAIGNLEFFDKNSLIENVEAAKTAIGPGNRMTQAEFTRFNNALLNLRTTAGGAKKILNYMEKLNQLAVDRNEFMQHFKQKETGARHQFDVNVAEDAWNRYLLKNPELYHFAGGEE